MSTTRAVPLWNIANVLTMFRMALVPIFAVLLLEAANENATGRWLAMTVFAIAVFTDKLDGELARGRGLVTDFGRLMDPIADKVLMGTGLIVLAILGELPWWVPFVILVREVGITAWRLTVAHKRVIPADAGGKIKTVLQSCAIGLFCMPLFALPFWVRVTAWVFMSAAIAMTLISGAMYLLAARRK